MSACVNCAQFIHLYPLIASLLQGGHDHTENEKALVASLEQTRKKLENEQKEKRACEKESKKRKNEMKKLNLLVHR